MTESLSKSETLPEVQIQKPDEKPDCEIIELTEADLERIENRFKKRRDLLTKSCLAHGQKKVETYDEMGQKQHIFLMNQIFHDEDLKLFGCLPPKTGTTSWNHFWWGTSNFQNKYDSFQSQGNHFRKNWMKILHHEKPEMLFLTVRHPIMRLISGWNNILCDKNCRNQDLASFFRVFHSLRHSVI